MQWTTWANVLTVVTTLLALTGVAIKVGRIFTSHLAMLSKLSDTLDLVHATAQKLDEHIASHQVEGTANASSPVQ